MTSYFKHESAFVDGPCSIGEGTKIWHFCHVMKNATIGRNCILGQNVSIAGDAVIGNNVKIQNNVSVYTGTTIEDGAAPIRTAPFRRPLPRGRSG